MAFNEELRNRVRDCLASKQGIVEKKMFGGVAYLLCGTVLVGVWKDSLIVRLGPTEAAKARREPFVKEFEITGRPMKGWLLVEPASFTDEDQLITWIQRATQFVITLPAK